MEHDEKEFEARANRIARGMWLAMLVVFSVAYAVEVAKGRRSTAYYAMLLVCGCKKAAVEIPATGTPTDPGKPTDPDSSQTGDNSNMLLWIALLFISGGAVIGITVYSKKKKENAE